MSEDDQKISFRKKFSAGSNKDVEKSFDEPAGRISPKSPKFCTHYLKKIRKKKFLNETFSSKDSSGQVQSSFIKPAESFFSKMPKYYLLNVRERHFLFKKIIPKLFFWARREQIGQPRQRIFIKSETPFLSVSEISVRISI